MVWEVIAGQALSAGLGAYASNQAANAQEEAAKKAADASNRGSLAQMYLQEPQRQIGYQALGDIASMYGYSQAPYTTIGDLQSTTQTLTAKQVKQLLASGATFDQIKRMGTLGSGGRDGKFIKKLTKLGLTVDQIQQLREGPGNASTTPGTPATGAAEGQPAAGNMSRFFASPDYQFRQQEGATAIDRSAAARSGALSGNAVRAQTDYASNLASGEYNNYMNRLFQVAGIGTAATNNVTNVIGNNTNAQSQAAQQTGDARASGIMGAANSAGSAINNGLGLYYLQQQLGQPKQPTGFMPQPGMGITKLPGTFSGINPGAPTPWYLGGDT